MSAQRQRRDEWMDQPGLPAAVHRQALAGLRRINALTRVSDSIWNALPFDSLAAGQALRVLDLACGGGDLVAALGNRAKRANAALDISGCDISPIAIEVAAEQAAAADLAAKFYVHDILRAELPEAYDVVICSLFLHHLEAPEVVTTLQRMARAARRAVVVSDLVRSTWNRWMVWWGSRLLSRSPVVHFDGPVSVDAAFTPEELRNLAEAAGLSPVTIRMQWPARMLMCWKRT
jgi:2-polyprenyl-3-methyl-5-hydroxy-6-metoxy-1,4-benzoquinol methylase